MLEVRDRDAEALIRVYRVGERLGERVRRRDLQRRGLEAVGNGDFGERGEGLLAAQGLDGGVELELWGLLLRLRLWAGWESGLW